MLDKRALRREIAAQKRALSPAQIEAASADLTAQLLAHPLFRAARSFYAYLSYNQEVRTLPLIRQAQALGKRVAVPKVYDGPEADDPAALVLMPGLAFDPQGHRLGYGGGFYDRFLAAEPHPTIALCYAFQLLPQLETEAHDIPVDAVLSAPV